MLWYKRDVDGSKQIAQHPSRQQVGILAPTSFLYGQPPVSRKLFFRILFFQNFLFPDFAEFQLARLSFLPKNHFFRNSYFPKFPFGLENREFGKLGIRQVENQIFPNFMNSNLPDCHFFRILISPNFHSARKMDNRKNKNSENCEPDK